MKNRILWADYVKAITIWLMVLGHSSLCNSSLMNFITAFHVPLFFLISGFFEKGKERTFKIRISKGWKQILLPFLFFNVIGLLSCWISPYLHPDLYYNIHGYKIFTNAILGIFLMDDFVTPFSYLPVGPSWFLIALFICKILFGCFVEISKKQGFLKFFLYLLFIISVYLLYQPQIHFASFDSAALSFPFYLCGFYLKQSNILERSMKKWLLFITLSLLTITCYILSQYNGFVGVDGGNYGNSLFLFFMDALLGIFMMIAFCILLSMCLKRIKILSYIGENTLTILGVHISMLYIVKYVFVKVFNSDMSNLHTLTSIIISIITLMLSLMLAFIFNKYCPQFVGKQNFNKKI